MVKHVASTEFQNRAGFYMDRAAKAPIFITRHNRPVRVLLDIDEYERLAALDTRRVWLAEELPDDWIEAIAAATTDHIDPALDRLMD